MRRVLILCLAIGLVVSTAHTQGQRGPTLSEDLKAALANGKRVRVIVQAEENALQSVRTRLSCGLKRQLAGAMSLELTAQEFNDLKSDVGLVSFRPGCPVRTVRLASASYQVRRNDPVVSIGCNNGSEPTVRSSRVTSLDKFLGPPNIQVAGQPVQGRSGGGLFSADGRVIASCPTTGATH